MKLKHLHTQAGHRVGQGRPAPLGSSTSACTGKRQTQLVMDPQPVTSYPYPLITATQPVFNYLLQAGGSIR